MRGLPRRIELLTVLALALGASTGRADEPARPLAPEPKPSSPGRRAVERGLEFLQADAAKWRKERECSTCHHGTMTVFALSEAKAHGYDVGPEALADLTKWTKDRHLERIDLPRDTRPGWSMVNTPAIYLSLLALAVPGQDAVSAKDLTRIAAHLLRHQEADGSWAWSSAPPKNRPPPFFESDEVATLLAYTVLGPQAPADPNAKSEVRDARERAAVWLTKATPTDTTQAAAIRLLVRVRSGEPAKVVEREIDKLIARQNKDGGWGQLKDLPSDAYATGQVLYVLSLAGVKPARAEVRSAVNFLVTTQKDDGSWPMTPRSHPDATPAKNAVPITYFGSAWATIGLVRSVDNPPAGPGEPRKLEVKVEGKDLTIGGKKLALPCERKALVEVMGPPSRILKKANTLLVWDELGVFAYERPKSDSINQVSIALGDVTTTMDFWPKKAFAGTLTLDGAAVTADATIDAINTAKKGESLKASGIARFMSEINYGDVAIVICKAKNGMFDADGSLAEFLVSSRRKNP